MSEHIINEILATEENYVNALKLVCEEYMPDIESELPGENKNILFGNIELIYMFHDVVFLTELKETPKIPAEIAQVFLKHKKQFSLYRDYNKNKPDADVLLSKYNSFFKKKQQDLNGIFDLQSYLITPTQRLCRYTLMMEDLAKHCKKHNTPNEDVLEVINMLKSETRLGNNLMAIGAIKNCDIDLKDQGDLTYRDAFNVSTDSGVKYSAMVFLFEKIILFTKKILENNRDVLYYQDFIYLEDIGLTELPDNPKKFKVWFHKRTLKPFCLETFDKSIKQRWVNEIRKQLQRQLDRILKETAGRKRRMIDLK